MKFPYSYRRSQEELVEAMLVAARVGHLVVEAGTGVGKTVCALCAAGTEALAGNKTVLYLVRTNSQQRQVILESRRLGLKTAALQGRHNLCLLLCEDKEFRSATPEELSKACHDKKAQTIRGEGGCRYYETLLHGRSEELWDWALKRVPTAEEIRARCVSSGICPYEFTKALLPRVNVVTAPYIYFFSPSLRHALLRWMAVPIEDITLVVDEAHNLPEYARTLGSARMSLVSLRMAKVETEQFGDPEVLEGVSIADVTELVKGALMEFAEEFVRDDDGLLPPSAFEESLMSSLGTTSARIKRMAQNIMVQGEIVREQKARAGRIPKSFIAALGSFLLFWFNEDGWEYVRMVTGGENPALECYCLDPSEVTRVVCDCHSSIHMSGTLTPLEEYRDSIGLPPETILRRFPSPFPPENRLVLVAEGLTTKYEVLASDKSAIERLKDELGRILTAVERNTAVFFPSHELMRQFLDLRDKIGRALYVEEQGMEQSDIMELIERFRADNAVLFAVFGGRIGEGMDFPAEDLELVALVGVPYPKPTARVKSMVSFYDAKFQRGWEYAVEAPTRRKFMQAMGRLIRSETDRGVAIILDGRARRFRDSIPAMTTRSNLLGDVKAFFNRGEAMPRDSAGSAAQAGAYSKLV